MLSWLDAEIKKPDPLNYRWKDRRLSGNSSVLNIIFF